jgi:hypothetical protein
MQSTPFVSRPDSKAYNLLTLTLIPAKDISAASNAEFVITGFRHAKVHKYLRQIFEFILIFW